MSAICAEPAQIASSSTTEEADSRYRDFEDMKQAPDDISELNLVARAKVGDQDAFRRLYDRHLERVRGQVHRLLGPRSNALDDVVQDVFVQAYRSLPKFRGDAAFSTWLFRLAHNVTVSHIRRSAARPVDLIGLRTLGEGVHQPNFDARRKVSALYSALDDLSDEAREAFVLYELEGKTLREIAEIVQAPLNTIAARVRRARARLKHLVERASDRARSAR